ncbi:SDR family NAD(P)-dependent oxidoreductase [Legionella maioricensis]|uniref:SDR family NAD(P)-dependent oxidoreductase n=1 Tax=Legionella maioricensis TaxID=2896528 RepID=A0A9X2D3F0_9GAMM|nr:SDR family NAD(P)-dependent oxidoreductase [Legionella maioricensis]MCL9684927.1 SDR family NAD(P)-dependent oxidoreductase [Legionella maioricensis]MCL9688241.1 SDR family NAD(P)-dependent oxidoreductase [Legionella maioricensis]
MDLQLNGKTALVTGSTAGIGFAIVEVLAREGAAVVINGRSEERIKQAIQKIKASVPSAQLIAAPADISNPKEIEALIHQVPTVDILVNNAGIYEVKPFINISDEEWLRMFNTNVMSGVRLSRHYLASMLKQNWGRIIFISSESGLQIPAEMVHYGMSKTAQLAIARGIAETTAGTQVTVNSILPGPTSSEGIVQFVKSIGKEQSKSPEQVEKDVFTTMRPSSLIKRFAAPEEIANMVAFICSPLSAATNGASVRVDGGILRSIA